MKPVPIHQAKTHLSRYVEQAKRGRKVYIGGYGRSEVVLMKARPASSLWGVLKGKTGYTEASWQKAGRAVGRDFARSLKS